jgi:hypothetical protein
LLSIDVLEYTTSLVVIIKEAGCFARQKNSLAPWTKTPRTGRRRERREKQKQDVRERVGSVFWGIIQHCLFIQ